MPGMQFEKFFAKQELKLAATSGVGSVVGTVAGMRMKLAVGVAMAAWLFVDCFWVGWARTAWQRLAPEVGAASIRGDPARTVGADVNSIYLNSRYRAAESV